MFPYEPEVSEMIRDEFPDVFDNSSQLIDLAVSIYNKLDAACPVPRREHETAAAALLHQNMRRFRSVVLLCEIGHVMDADILTRSIYETELAFRFIFKRRKNKNQCIAQLRTKIEEALDLLPTSADLKPNAKKMTASELRATLYFASSVIKLEKLARRVSQIKGLERLFSKQSLKNLDKEVSEIQAKIGKKWVQAIKKTNSYSGIRGVDLLSELYGLYDYYVTIYGIQSSKSHGQGAMEFLNGVDHTQVPKGISLAGELLFLTVSETDHVFGLNSKKEISSFSQKWKESFK